MSSPGAARVSISDTETWEKNKRYTVYKVLVSVNGKSWFIFRRYNEFYALYERLKKLFPEARLKLPGKKLFGNMDPEFIHKRRTGLHDFIQKLITNPRLSAHPDVQVFLNLENPRHTSRQVDDDIKTGALEDDKSDRSETLTADKNGSSASDTAMVVDDNNPRVNLGDSEKIHARPSDFEFLKVIGKGSFGKVLLAKRKDDGNIYAVKVLQKAQIMKRNEAKHIMAERNVLLKNIQHPFLVGLHYSFQTPDKLYFVLDYVNGGELFFHLQKERIFEEARAKFYAAEMASAIGYLHSLNIIYRDLKPENILLDYQGHVVLTDFGLCKENIEGSSTTSTFCGTPEYLAPEVLKKLPYDRTVDWWCLGAVLYEMLYGLPPFYSRDTSEMYNSILNKPLRLRDGVTSQAKGILEGLLQKEKERRLGANADFFDIKSHAFFADINWKELDARRIKPPYNPNVKGHMDLKHFDPDFVREPVPASVGKSATAVHISASVQEADNAFEGFSYVPAAEEDAYL